MHGTEPSIVTDEEAAQGLIVVVLLLIGMLATGSALWTLVMGC